MKLANEYLDSCYVIDAVKAETARRGNGADWNCRVALYKKAHPGLRYTPSTTLTPIEITHLRNMKGDY